MPTITLTAFDVRTCEERAQGAKEHRLWPSFGEDPTYFLVQDPFGLRRSIVPTFWLAPDGSLTGYGTAFSADHWGTFLTADHVISDFRRPGPRGQMSRGPTAPIETQMEDGRIMVMLGMGLVFGSFGIPERALLTMKSFWTPALIGDDPLAAMQGRPDYHPLDLTVMQMTPTPAADLIATLPMKSRQPGLRVGDVVVAVGFPEIETFKGTLADAVTTIREGMYAAYGVVTRLYPEGRENNRLGTPLFEVEANWPSGMSGGPVLNKDGEIIGLVSRSIAPEAGQKTGTGWATWFAPFSDFDKWLPSLDPDNPCWRKGWAVRRSAPWSIHGVYPTTEDAEHALVEAGPGYEVVFGSWRVGSDDFMSSQTVYS